MTPADQQVVREVMEGIYRKFDRNGVRENDEALAALLGNGLVQASPDPAEVEEWRAIVAASHREMAGQGVFDRALYDRVQSLLETFRSGGAASAP